MKAKSIILPFLIAAIAGCKSMEADKFIARPINGSLKHKIIARAMIGDNGLFNVGDTVLINNSAQIMSSTGVGAEIVILIKKI